MACIQRAPVIKESVMGSKKSKSKVPRYYERPNDGGVDKSITIVCTTRSGMRMPMRVHAEVQVNKQHDKGKSCRFVK